MTDQPSSHLEKILLEAYDKHADEIFRFCYFKVSDRELAKDFAQDVFMKLWQYLLKGHVVGNPRAFLFTVASNHIKDHWKKKKAIPMSVLESKDEEGTSFDAPDESVNIVSGTEVRRTIETFSRLADDDRTLLSLRFVEDLPVKEIAAVLGERENTISVRLTRALTRLRALLT